MENHHFLTDLFQAFLCFFSGCLRSWRTVRMRCQMMLLERVVGLRCCFRDDAEAVPQQIKLVVNAFAAMLSHHARADLPLGNKLYDMLFQIVKLREDSWLRVKFAVVMQELLNVRQKHEAYAHRSLIDLLTAKVLPAEAHTFAKNVVGTDFSLIF